MKNTILIFRSEKGYKNEEIETLLETAIPFKTEQSFYDDIYLEFSNYKTPVLLINNKSIFEYGLVYFFGLFKLPELSFVIANILKKEKKNVFIDQSTGAVIRGGKLMQMINCHNSSLPIPKTIFVSREIIKENIEKVIASLGTPFIMKTTSGSLGNEVFLINNLEDIQNLYNKYPSAIFIFQEFIPNDFDYRIMVLGYKPKVIVKRTRTTNSEFRNNTAQGAKKEFLELQDVDKEILTIAGDCCKVLKKEIAGVDIVVNKYNHQPFILEVNSSPGFDSPEQLKVIREYIKELIDSTTK